MAKKPTVTTVASGYYGRQALNDNFTSLRDAFDNTLSRDGSTPNAMGADLDMNSNDILNAQTVNTESLRLDGILVGSSDLSAAGATLYSDNYTGDGTTVAYTMSYQPFIKDNTQVYIDGVYQNKAGYSISGTTLTFSAAPPLNSAIEIVVARSLTSSGAVDAANVSYTQGSTGSVNTTVESKLQETVSVKDFGAVGDGVTDDTAAFVNAASAVSSQGVGLYLPAGTYRLTSFVDFTFIPYIDGEGIITLDHAGVGVLLGGNRQGQFYYYNINNIQRKSGQPTTEPSVKIQTMLNSIVNIGRVDYLQLKPDGDDVNKNFISYNTFRMGRVTKLEITNEGSAEAPVNENKFIGGRLQTLIANSPQGYIHNNNEFVDSSLENADVDLDYCSDFQIIGRFEGGSPTVVFGSNTDNNLVTEEWWGSSANSQSRGSAVRVSVTDNGVNNFVVRRHWANVDRKEIVNINGSSLIVDSGSNIKGVANIEPALGKVKITSGQFYKSELIPAQKDIAYAFKISHQVSRPTVYLFDENMQRITSVSNPNYGSLSGGGSWTSNSYTYGTDVGGNAASEIYVFSLADTSVAKYIQLIFEVGSAGASFIDGFSIYALTKTNFTDFVQWQPSPAVPIVVSASPTKGYVPVGVEVTNPATAKYECTYAFESNLNGALASAATAVTVDAIGSVASGDIVGILLADGTTHWDSVNGSPVGNSLVLTTGVPSAANDGARIVFNRWA